MKHSVLNFSILILVALASTWYINVKVKEAISDFEKLGAVQNIFDARDLEKVVMMISPKKGDVISTPVKIEGSVSGRWFFEGVIVGKITDRDGEILGQGPLTAKGAVTEKDVNFEGIIPFSNSTSKDGFVVIEADDPSGMGEIQSYKIPVTFEGTLASPCTGDECGDVLSCEGGSIGTNKVCVHDEKNL